MFSSKSESYATDDSKYVACIEAARSIATCEVTDGQSSGIDEKTRSAARTFLREEFDSWRTDKEPDPEPAEEPEEPE